jgi:hypothetical protein
MLYPELKLGHLTQVFKVIGHRNFIVLAADRPQ